MARVTSNAIGTLAFVAVMTAVSATVASAGMYTEHFASSTYFDAAHSTALWDTAGGRIALHPFDLTQIGACATAATAAGVALHGDYAFVCEFSAGVGVIDISNVTAPSAAGIYNTSGSAYDAVVAGDYLYVADAGAGLLVLDISSPTAPAYAGLYNTPGSARAVAVAGNYAFVADHSNGFVAVDITDPTNPVLAGRVATTNLAMDVVVAGDVAYVATYDGGVDVIDITDPTPPTSIGSYNTPGQAWYVSLDGNFLYVGDAAGGLQVLDVTDPTNPALAGGYDTSGEAQGSVVAGDYLYLADGPSGVHVFDIADPGDPILLDTYDTPGYAGQIALAGECAFLVDGSGGFRVLRACETYGPVRVAGAETGSGFNLAVAGDYAYAVSCGRFDAFSIADPRTPVMVGGGSLLGWAVSAGIALAGHLAYVFGTDSLGADSLYIVDVSDPENPALAVSLPCSTAFIRIDGDQLFGLGGSTFIVSDLTDPLSPSTMGETPIGGQGVLRVRGDLVCTTGYDDGLHTFDVSDPANPAEMGSYYGFGTSEPCLDVDGDLAYTATRAISYRVRVVDVSNPTSPVLLSTTYSLHDPGDRGIYEMLADGDRLFVLSENLEIVDISDPSAPAYISDTGVSSLHHDPVLAGDYLYVMSNGSMGGFDGLEVFQVYQREIDSSRYIIQSLDIEPSGNTVEKARLSAMQTGSIAWYLSADSGAHWVEVAPDNEWVEFAPHTGSELLWKAHLFYDEGIAPDCTSLTIEWQTGTDVPEDNYPERFAIRQNVPNPFNPTTTVGYDVPAPGGVVSIAVYDAAGRRVKMLVEGLETPGAKQVVWNGQNERGFLVSSGVYYCRMTAEGFDSKVKLTLLK